MSQPMWIFDRVTQEFLSMTILDIRPAADIPELLGQTLDPRLRGPSTAEKWGHQTKNGTIFPAAITSWDLTFHGRHAELVLASREGPVHAAAGSSPSSFTSLLI